LVEDGAAISVASTNVPARSAVGVDGGEEALAQVVGFEKMTEVQQGGGIGHAFGAQIKAGKIPQGLAVVERVFEGFIGKAIPLLEKIDPQHPLQAQRWPTAFALGIEGFDDGQQLRPRNHCLHTREKLFTAGGLLFGGKLGVGETRWMRHAAQFKPTPRSRRL